MSEVQALLTQLRAFRQPGEGNADIRTLPQGIFIFKNDILAYGPFPTMQMAVDWIDPEESRVLSRRMRAAAKKVK